MGHCQPKNLTFVLVLTCMQLLMEHSPLLPHPLCLRTSRHFPLKFGLHISWVGEQWTEHSFLQLPFCLFTGGFVWNSNTSDPVTYTSWTSDEPDDGDCIELRSSKDYKWMPRTCKLTISGHYLPTPNSCFRSWATYHCDYDESVYICSRDPNPEKYWGAWPTTVESGTDVFYARN